MNDKSNGCKCENCNCTPEKHCGCYSKAGCQCPANCTNCAEHNSNKKSCGCNH